MKNIIIEIVCKEPYGPTYAILNVPAYITQFYFGQILIIPDIGENEIEVIPVQDQQEFCSVTFFHSLEEAQNAATEFKEKMLGN